MGKGHLYIKFKPFYLGDRIDQLPTSRSFGFGSYRYVNLITTTTDLEKTFTEAIDMTILIEHLFTKWIMDMTIFWRYGEYLLNQKWIGPDLIDKIRFALFMCQ